MIGHNGRPIVLANVKYKVDVNALEEFVASDAAQAAASADDKVRSKITKRDLVGRFLKHVERGYCTVSYTRSEIGQALVDKGYIQHSRLYPDRWPSCVTQLSKDLRAIALGPYYVEMDDKDAFHRLVQASTKNGHAKQLIEQLVTDEFLKPNLSQHYFGDSSHIHEVKQLLHAMSNEGSPRAWRTHPNQKSTIVEN